MTIFAVRHGKHIYTSLTLKGLCVKLAHFGLAVDWRRYEVYDYKEGNQLCTIGYDACRRCWLTYRKCEQGEIASIIY